MPCTDAMFYLSWVIRNNLKSLQPGLGEFNIVLCFCLSSGVSVFTLEDHNTGNSGKGNPETHGINVHPRRVAWLGRKIKAYKSLRFHWDVH